MTKVIFFKNIFINRMKITIVMLIIKLRIKPNSDSSAIAESVRFYVCDI